MFREPCWTWVGSSDRIGLTVHAFRRNDHHRGFSTVTNQFNGPGFLVCEFLLQSDGAEYRTFRIPQAVPLNPNWGWLAFVARFGIASIYWNDPRAAEALSRLEVWMVRNQVSASNLASGWLAEQDRFRE